MTSAKKVTQDDIDKVVKGGVQTNKIETFMTDIITRDIFLANKKNAETLLTKELDRIYATETPAKITATKQWVKTKLQVLVKAKSVQRRLLGDDVKTKSITIKKVNNGVLTDDKCLNKNLFKDKDLGLFKVIIQAKKVTEEKTFEEELTKLMTKHDKFPNDLIEWIQTQMTDTQIMDELEVAKVA
tara:strand:- start:4009 stop:4563 length:555 start_codon:yes stop_codon:yes gene_type:complete